MGEYEWSMELSCPGCDGAGYYVARFRPSPGHRSTCPLCEGCGEVQKRLVPQYRPAAEHLRKQRTA